MIETNPIVCRMWRGPAVESLHRGAWVMSRSDGAIVRSNSEPDQLMFARSATKPFQALPLLLSGAADAFSFDGGDIALAMASHSGESIHVERVLAILDRLSLVEGDLQCGPQTPIASWSEQTTRRAANNCSGKHAGFLAVARQLDTDPSDYLNPSGPVQRAVFEAVQSMTGAVGQLELGTDGCSAPTFRLPLSGLARGIAGVANPEALKADVAGACKRMTDAAAANPELIGGTSERFDTDLIRVSNGRLLAKIGAEAAFAVGVVGVDVGYALKIDDGDGRAIAPLLIDLLAAEGHLSTHERHELGEWDIRVRRNWDGLDIGRIETNQ